MVAWATKSGFQVATPAGVLIGPFPCCAARSAFGEKGVVNMICLAGQYMTISGLLHTFAVPTPEAG